MKRLGLLFLFLQFFTQSLKAQQCFTDTSNTVKVTHEQVQEYMNSKGSQRSEAIEYIPVKVHVVEDGYGSRVPSNLIYEAFDQLNDIYQAHNMFFYFCSDFDIITSEALYTLDTEAENSDMVAGRVQHAINIYYVGSIRHRFACGYATLGSSNAGYIVIQRGCESYNTLAHEMGHYLNLYHTHDPVGGVAELVNGSNCATAGDLICDTPADPNVYQKVSSSCTYQGTETDANGQAYNPPLNNYMSYSNHSCRNQFTNQQWQRMLMYYDTYAKAILSCTPKVDFVIGLNDLTFFTSGQVNTLSVVLTNFSPIAYNGSVRLKLTLKSGDGTITEIYNQVISGNWSAYTDHPLPVSVNIPSALKNGGYELTAEINPDRIVDESEYTSNVVKVKVGVYAQSANLPDLEVQLNGPSTYTIGKSYAFSYTISNIGTESSDGPGIEYFVSKDPYLSKDDTYFGPYGSSSFNAGATETLSDAVLFPTESLTPYYLIVYIDRSQNIKELNENNNYKVIQVNGVPAATNATMPDIQFTTTSVTNGTVYTVPKTDATPQFTCNIQNTGIGAASRVSAGLFLSSDAAWSADDLLLDSKQVYIYPNKTGNFFVSSYIPKNIATGSYHLIIQLNYDGYLIESNYTNNTIVVQANVVDGSLPKFVVKEITTANFWQLGQPWNLNTKILNEGYGEAATSAWSAFVHLHQDKAVYEFPLSSSQAFSKKYNIPSAIAVNQTFPYQFTGTVPSDVEEGYYYVQVCAQRNDFRKGNSHCLVYDQPVFVGQSLPTSIEDELDQQESNFLVFPNPAQHYITVKSTKQALAYKLISFEGREISVKEENNTIAVDGLTKGLYILQMIAEDKVYSTKLIIE